MQARAGSGVMLHKQALLLCLVAGLVFLYLVYSWTSSKSNPVSSGTRLKRLNTWKTNDFVDIPLAVIESAKELTILQKQLLLTVSDTSLDIFYRTIDTPRQDNNKRSVLFLHGAASSSEIWEQIGSMQLVAALGHKPFAIDLPGWAKSKNSKIKKEDGAAFLEVLIRELKLDRPIIVSASMSGMFSVPYIMNPDPNTCMDRVGAFVPLAPVYTEKFMHAEYHRCEIPTMIVYGTKDTQLGLLSVGNLRNMPNSEIEEMQGAGHAGYQDRPTEWHRLLYNFLLAVGHV